MKRTKKWKERIGIANKVTPKAFSEGHGMWKGNQVSYSGLHHWVVSHRGKPDTCEHCGTQGLSGRKIQWANKSHEYKRTLEDWLRLCIACHIQYDKSFK